MGNSNLKPHLESRGGRGILNVPKLRLELRHELSLPFFDIRCLAFDSLRLNTQDF